MQGSLLTRPRLIGIFLLGVILLYSPILTLFDRPRDWGGFPLVFLYVFGAWLLLVVLTALTVERRNR